MVARCRLKEAVGHPWVRVKPCRRYQHAVASPPRRARPGDGDTWMVGPIHARPQHRQSRACPRSVRSVTGATECPHGGRRRLRPRRSWTPPSWDEMVRTHSARRLPAAYRLTGNHTTPRTSPRTSSSGSSVPVDLQPGTFERLHRITTNLFLDQVRRQQRIRFDALADDAGERRLPRPRPGAGLRRTTSTTTCSARSTRSAGLPRRRGPLRHRGPLVRGDPATSTSPARSAAGSIAAGRSCARNHQPPVARRSTSECCSRPRRSHAALSRRPRT